MSELFDFDNIQLIGEMSKAELIDELVRYWRGELMTKDMTNLKQQVIELRMMKIRERMIKEAGLKREPGFMGFPRLTEDDDE